MMYKAKRFFVLLGIILLMSACSVFSNEATDISKDAVFERKIPNKIVWADDVIDWKFSTYGKLMGTFIFWCHYDNAPDTEWELCTPENLKEE